MATRKRKEGELFEDYRENLRVEAMTSKIAAKGRFFWNTKKQGIYVKAQQA